MPRNIVLYVMAAALGVLMAFGIRDAGAQEPGASITYFFDKAEEISAEYNHKPYLFKHSERDGETLVWVYFSADSVGTYLYWKEGECKATMIKLPWQTMRIEFGEKEWMDLVAEYKAWINEAKGTGI